MDNLESQNKIKLAFLLLGGNIIGGADIRYARLYNYTKEQKEFKVRFITNPGKYEHLKNLKILDKNIDPGILIVGNENSTLNEKIQLKSNYKKYIPYFIISMKRWILLWISFYRNLKNTSLLIKKYNINVLYCLYLGAFLSPFLKKKLDIKIICAQMDSTFQYLSKNIFKACNSYYYAFKKSDIVDCLGDSYRDGFKKYKIDVNNTSKYKVAPCSFTDESKCHAKEKKKIITFASRLTKSKNPLLFLDVCKLIYSTKKDVQFRLLGSGELENDIINFIKRNELSGVVDFKYSYDIYDSLSDSILFLSLQENENYPSQSLLEACLCENMIVATNTGDTFKLVKEPFGKLVSFQPDEISKVCINIINDFERGIFFGSEAKKFVLNNHSIKKYYNHFSNLIQT